MAEGVFGPRRENLPIHRPEEDNTRRSAAKNELVPIDRDPVPEEFVESLGLDIDTNYTDTEIENNVSETSYLFTEILRPLN